MGPDHTKLALISTLSMLFHVLVQLGLGVTFTTIALTTVRRLRRDVMSWFLAYGVGLILLAVLSPIAHWGSNIAAAAAGNLLSVVVTNSAVSLGIAVLYAVNAGLLATGIIKIARLPAARYD